MMLRAQLAILQKDAGLATLQKQVRETAQRIAEKEAVPAVKAVMPMVLDVAGEEWWDGVTLPMVEEARLALRSLVQFIDRAHRHVVITDFEDHIGLGLVHEVPGISSVDTATYKRRVLAFLDKHSDDLALQKVKRNKPITPQDLVHLDALLYAQPDSLARDEISRIPGQDQPLGLFIRSLVGMDRTAAIEAFGRFLDSSRYSPNQIRFVEYIVDYLTRNGVMPPELLYEAPCTDHSPKGVDGVFVEDDAISIVELLREAITNVGGDETRSA